MPYYVDNERLIAIWFYGKLWFIGDLSDLEEGQFGLGFFHSDEFGDCPTDTTEWQEAFDGEWNTNPNAKLTGYSK